jgi:hypothetical protein
MRWFNCLVGPMAAVLAAGCAATSDSAVGSGAEAASSVAAENASVAAASPSDGAGAAQLNPGIVDLRHVPQGDRTGYICREMLKPASNVIVTYCGTPAAWKVYERHQARWSQEIVRMMQGGAYR